MANKVYSVTVTLPDLVAAHAEQEARVESPSWAAAVRLACEEISRRPHVRGKHIKRAKIDFSVVESAARSAAPGEAEPARRDDAADGQGFLFEI
jgi:hypothetical protein